MTHLLDAVPIGPHVIAWQIIPMGLPEWDLRFELDAYGHVDVVNVTGIVGETHLQDLQQMVDMFQTVREAPELWINRDRSTD